MPWHPTGAGDETLAMEPLTPAAPTTHAATSAAPAAAPVAVQLPPELVCPAGSLPALKAAVDHGANCVYLGLRDATNARNFAGLNFDEAAIANGIAYAHQRLVRRRKATPIQIQFIAHPD
eukprot:gene35901-44267_t